MKVLCELLFLKLPLNVHCVSFFHLIGELCIINMSEKLCLQWNDFQENIKSAFGNLREDCDFADVTLACEDDQQVEAHKVILAASSLFSRICF